MPEGDVPLYFFTPEKRKLRSLLTMFNLFVSKNKKKSIHESVSNSGNPIVKVLYGILEDMAPQIVDHVRMTGRTPDSRYRDILREVIEFGLYVYYNDTAYMDMGDYWLLQMYQPENAERILTYLEKYQPDIKRSYYNIWEGFKKETRDLEDKGLLVRGQLGEDEMLLVNEDIERKVKKFSKEGK